MNTPTHNKPTPAHTPTPWNLHRAYDGEPLAVERENGNAFVSAQLVIARDEKIIAEVVFRGGLNGGWPHVDSMEEFRANAAFIVRAVNNHEALVAALERQIAHTEQLANMNNHFAAKLGIGKKVNVEDWTDRARSAIDAAMSKEGQP